ncbi:MAG: MATE family efflux transporter, partial [Mycoplasmataceae bacterium]|nr:MATE family efflux transporter [Mycoplasmataceae bacterium]
MLKINKEIKFDKPFIKRSLKIMVPIILAQILIVTVGFVDNFMVTGFDSEQIHLTAVGAGAEMWFGMSSLYFSVGIVFGMFYAQFSSNPDKSNFKQTFKLNIHVSIGVAIVVSSIMYILAPQIMSLFFLSDPKNAFTTESKMWAVDYFRIMAIGNIFASMSYLLLNPLLIIGKAKYMLFVSIISLLTNVLLDYLMIYVIDAKGTEGAVGAAWSTIISYFIQLLISAY